MNSETYTIAIEKYIEYIVRGKFEQMEHLFGDEYYTKIFPYLCQILATQNRNYSHFIIMLLHNFDSFLKYFSFDYDVFIQFIYEFEMCDFIEMNKFKPFNVYSKLESPVWFGNDKPLNIVYEQRTEYLYEIFSRDPFGTKYNQELIDLYQVKDILKDHPQFFLQIYEVLKMNPRLPGYEYFNAFKNIVKELNKDGIYAYTGKIENYRYYRTFYDVYAKCRHIKFNEMDSRAMEKRYNRRNRSQI